MCLVGSSRLAPVLVLYPGLSTYLIRYVCLCVCLCVCVCRELVVEYPMHHVDDHFTLLAQVLYERCRTVMVGYLYSSRLLSRSGLL